MVIDHGVRAWYRSARSRPARSRGPAIATVDLAEGACVFGRLEARARSPGGAVTATFVDHDDWTELRFRPVEVDE
jgi:hypothetical protein